MVKNTNSKFVNEILKDLKTTSMYLSEAYIFNEEGPEGMGMEGPQPPMGDGAPMQGEVGSQMTQGNSEEEKAMRAEEIIQHEPIVAKIREIAIDGLKKYAEHPTSEIYSYFKSVFLDTDKLLTKSGGK